MSLTATGGVKLGGNGSIVFHKNKKHQDLSILVDDNEKVAKWFVDILDGIKKLKKSKIKITTQELKDEIDALFTLSNNMPKN